MPQVVCRGVTAGYGGDPVLHGIDLEVRTGEWLAVIGPNGSGKSTLLRVIAGTLSAVGEVSFNGHTVGSLRRREVAKAVAMVPQNPTMPEAMTVLDYVLLGRTPYIRYWGIEGREDLQVAQQVLRDLDLEGMGDRPLAALSGGERQRAVLARALAQQAPVLLLDEPTTALDVGHQQQVLELVDRMRAERDISVVAAMHDLTLAGQFADRLALLVDGRVVAAGTAARVLTVEALAAHYGADVAVLPGPDGTPVVTLRRVHAGEEQ